MAAPREIEGVRSVQSALAAAREPTARVALARALQRQLHQYGVIILKRQELTRQDLMDFSLLFGEELDRERAVALLKKLLDLLLREWGSIALGSEALQGC